jgi:hypothetical protein
MVRRRLLLTLAAGALVVAWSLDVGCLGSSARAAEIPYNFYVQPGTYGELGAQLYVCPLPTPPLVGHTYITYQPLAPHEFLYRHTRVYRVYHNGDGRTKVRVFSW